MLSVGHTCEVPIDWSPVRSERDDTYHKRINSLVQNVIQTYQARRQPQQEQPIEAEPDDNDDDVRQEPGGDAVASTLEPPQIDGVSLPAEEDFNKQYTSDSAFALWQGGDNHKRLLKDFTDMDVVVDIILHSDPQISEKIENTPVRKAFVTFLKGVKKDLKKTITYADVLAIRKSACLKKKRLLNVKMEELRFIQERKFKLMSKVKKLEQKRKIMA